MNGSADNRLWALVWICGVWAFLTLDCASDLVCLLFVCDNFNSALNKNRDPTIYVRFSWVTLLSLCLCCPKREWDIKSRKPGATSYSVFSSQFGERSEEKPSNKSFRAPTRKEERVSCWQVVLMCVRVSQVNPLKIHRCTVVTNNFQNPQVNRYNTLCT